MDGRETAPVNSPTEASEVWRRNAVDVVTELRTDARTGLTSAEAAVRLEHYGPNRLDAATAVPAWRRFLAQFEDPLIYLLLGAVVVSFVAWVLIASAALCASIRRASVSGQVEERPAFPRMT